jgi:exosortase
MHTVRPDTASALVARGVCFMLLVGLTLALFRAPLSLLFHFTLEREEYSHIVLIPVTSVVLLMLDRKRVFAVVGSAWGPGMTLLVAGGLLYGLGRGYAASPTENDRLVIAILSIVLIWMGGFLLCYGVRAFREGLFGLLLVFLIVPIPDAVLGRVIFWLQMGSAEVSYAMFQALNVPVFRTGFVFALPGLTIEVAKECSGIRSSLALLITTLLAGHLFLQSGWRKATLMLVALPLLVVKNGIRIVTLSLLSIYVDPSFLTGRLHHAGGIVFFLLALVILSPVLLWLQKSERIGRRSTLARTPVSGEGSS